MERSRSLQIYMKPGLREDDLLLRVWESAKRHDRPQDVFRALLRSGLRSMTESGELPEAIIEECGLDAIVERRRNRSRRNGDLPIQPPGFPPYPFFPQGYPVSTPVPAPVMSAPHPIVEPTQSSKSQVPTTPPPASPPSARVTETAPSGPPAATKNISEGEPDNAKSKSSGGGKRIGELM